MQKIIVFCFAIVCAVLSFLPNSYSDGILIPVPPEPRPIILPQIAIKYHKVNVDIDNQIATTSVDQVFINESPLQLEATYIFPLPAGVTINEGADPAVGEEKALTHQHRSHDDNGRTRTQQNRGENRAHQMARRSSGNREVQHLCSEDERGGNTEQGDSLRLDVSLRLAPCSSNANE